MTEMRFSNGAVAVPKAADAELRLPPTVLVVEDDDVDFMVIAELLRPIGCSIERASDLKMACRRAGRFGHPVDLVVADLHLGDGWPTITFDALAMAWDHKPIIVVSGCSPELSIIQRGTYPVVELFDKNAFDALTFLTTVQVALRAGRRFPRSSIPAGLSE